MSKIAAVIRRGGAGLAKRVDRIILVILFFGLGFLVRGFFVSDRGGEIAGGGAAAPAQETVWTCSMDPQIRLPTFGLCPVCNMDLIPAAGGGADDGEGMRRLTVSENALMLMDVETVPVERKRVTATVRMVGKVDYDETRLATITAWIPGRLDRLFVDYTGVPVIKGDHMVSLYSPELLTAQQELLQSLEAVENLQESNLGIVRESTEATAAAAREKLRLWGLTAEQIAEIETNRKVSDHVTINAPVEGIVIKKDALEGMYVKEGTPIYTIADLSQVWVKLDAYEADLEWVRYGQEVMFTTVSYPGEEFRGTVSFIDPVINEATRTAKVRVNVDNAEGRLKPGMFVRAAIQAQVARGGRVMDADLAGKWICPMHPDIVKEQVDTCDICEMPLVTTESLGYVSDDAISADEPLVIPASAAMVTGTRAVVYVQLIDEDEITFEGREIVLGPRAGDYYLVRSGLSEGELVVVKGNFKLDAELQIRARPSMMMSPDGGGGSGHEHGGMTMQEETPASDVTLDVLSRHQLERVVKAAGRIAEAATKDDLDMLQRALGTFRERLQKVDRERLVGAARGMWGEWSMRLSNDAAEGVDAANMEEATLMVRQLVQNVGSLKRQFGLHEVEAEPKRPVLAKELRDQLAAVFEGYFEIQGPLAGDDFAGAQEGVRMMTRAVKVVDARLFLSGSDDLWMKASENLHLILKESERATELQVLRESFHPLSQQMIALSRGFGAPGAEVFYVMNCPMAFDNRGADWLQDHEKLLNPYFGAMMLRCGTIDAVISND